METTLLWFKRDLRIADHPALAMAAARGPVLPVHVIEPEAWAQPDASARQYRFVAECLAELRGDLAALGQPLILRLGEVTAVFDALLAATPCTALISHQETGNAWSFARDRRVAAWTRARGLAWTELPQSGVVRRLGSRDGWAARRDAFTRQPCAGTPAALPPVRAEHPVPLPCPADLGLAPDPCPGRQAGGRRAAEERLASFLTDRGQSYRRAMSSPVTAFDACSRLSPHLAFGTLSGREAARAAAQRKAAVRGTREGWTGSLASFAARLAWRDHFMQKLETDPRIETECLHRAFEGLRPRTPDPARLAAWQSGQTGLPFVDACMRALSHTGWLNFRMRAMLMSVASYHLWLDWRATGAHLARLFADYEPGIHWSQTQMQSGTTGMNTLRIYNPIKQGLEHDPTGRFTRRWLPELNDVPDAHLQQPWRWEGAGRLLGRSYPEPVIDPSVAARAARDAVWAVRRQDGFRTETARLVARHASRKRPGRPPLRRSGTAQLSLDL
jgi:deoxyribodipyrimidine photo-lyase